VGVEAHRLARIAAARAKTRSVVRALIAARHGQVPAARRAGQWNLGKTVVIRLDASIVPVHPEKGWSAATLKKTFGHRLHGEAHRRTARAATPGFVDCAGTRRPPPGGTC
jgi:ribosomal protein L21E